eukprot:jgi/Undpi1/3560/HiC_scaffold_16.g06932.m1
MLAYRIREHSKTTQTIAKIEGNWCRWVEGTVYYCGDNTHILIPPLGQGSGFWSTWDWSRPDHCVVIKGPGSVSAGGSALTPPGKDRGGPSASTPTSGKDRRPKGSFGATERAPLTRKGSHLSLASEQCAASGIPSNAWGTGSEVGSVRKDAARKADGGSVYDKKGKSGGDDQIIGRLLASEAFSRVLAAAVADRVRTEVANREKQSKSEHEALLNRMCELEQMVDDAGGAMDDIASMVQTISETVALAPNETDSRDAAGGGGGGDAGGGGRDDARVAELTKLLCTVHDMSSQAADLLRSERKENQVRVQYLAERVNELESANRNLLAGEGSTPSEPMEG